MFKKVMLRIRKSVWLYPVLYSLISIVVASSVLAIDSRVFFEPEELLPKMMFTNIELARMILGAISGSLLTMTTFTFSTTMVVLTMYTSQYSPRTVENFLNDNITMKVLGVFMGGFIYSILSLLFMRDDISGYGVIAASVGVIYSIVCLAYFSVFINHVGNLIQANNLIDRLYLEAKENIAKYKDSIENARIEENPENDGMEIALNSHENGYIQLIDKSSIANVAKEVEGRVVIDKVIGQFVTDETEVMKVYLKSGRELEEEQINRLLNSITLGIDRNELQDFDFSVQKITEIALRAISPGINDPNTANHCIRIIGILMGLIADTKPGYIVEESEGGRSSTVFEAISFEKELYFAFYQLVHYGKSDVSVVLSIYKSLRSIIKKASPKNREIVYAFGDYIYSHIDESLKTGLDGKMIDIERAEIN